MGSRGIEHLQLNSVYVYRDKMPSVVMEKSDEKSVSSTRTVFETRDFASGKNQDLKDILLEERTPFKRHSTESSLVKKHVKYSRPSSSERRAFTPAGSEKRRRSVKTSFSPLSEVPGVRTHIKRKKSARGGRDSRQEDSALLAELSRHYIPLLPREIDMPDPGALSSDRLPSRNGARRPS